METAVSQQQNAVARFLFGLYMAVSNMTVKEEQTMKKMILMTANGMNLFEKDLEMLVQERDYRTIGQRLTEMEPQQASRWLARQDEQPKDHLCYLTRTPDGKILKSSSLYIRNSRGGVVAIFSINYDVSGLMMIQNTIGELLSTRDKEQTEPERIINVNAVLDELIDQSVAMVGKPVALMNKEDKVRAIQFLNQSGAFLVTKSGDKVAKYFGISKYTLYSYIDANKDGDK